MASKTRRNLSIEGAKGALTQHGANFMVASTLAIGIGAFASAFLAGLIPLIMGYNEWDGIWAHGYLLMSSIFALACLVPLALALFSKTVRNVFWHIVGDEVVVEKDVDHGIIAGTVGFNIVMFLMWCGAIVLTAIWTRRWVLQPGSTTWFENGTYAGMNPVDSNGLPTEPRNAVLLMSMVFYIVVISILHFLGGVVTTMYYMFSIPPRKFFATIGAFANPAKEKEYP